MTPALAASLGLNDSEYARASKELGRPPSYAELATLGVMWSERESQKSAKIHVRRLPTSGPHVVRGLEDGAGAVDIGDGFSAVFALESREGTDPGHTATAALGGALRDVLASGARPSAALDILRLGAADDARTGEALGRVVTRLGAYAKDAAISVIGGDLQLDAHGDPSLIQAVAIGVVRTDALLEARATGLGNTLLCVGARTGAESTDRQEASDAFVQRRLTDACLEAYRLGCVEGARAVGAAGLAGAAARLAARGDTGLELDLDALPRKTKGLVPADLLVSSSTERMLLVIKKGREDAVLEVLRRFDLEASLIGRVTNTGRLVVKATPDHDPFTGKPPEGRQAVVADLPVALLTTEAPAYERPTKPGQVDRTPPSLSLKRNEDAESELVRLLGSANVGSRDWIMRKVDASAAKAGAKQLGDAAIVRVQAGDDDANAEKLLALAVDGNARHTALDPRQGAAMAVAECARNAVCVGAEPLGLSHSLTFGNPDDPTTMWRVSETIDGIRDACLALKLPVVSGEIGFRSEGSSAVPVVAVVGLLRDASARLGMGFGRQADMVALLGAPGKGNLAGSEAIAARVSGAQGPALELDLAAEVKLQRAVQELARDKLLSSAHGVSEGGLGVCLAECCIAGRVGCSVELPTVAGVSELAMLFHEEPSRVVVSFPPEQRAKVQERCDALGVPFALLGFVGGDTLEIEDVLDVPVQVLAESHSRALATLVGE